MQGQTVYTLFTNEMLAREDIHIPMMKRHQKIMSTKEETGLPLGVDKGM